MKALRVVVYGERKRYEQDVNELARQLTQEDHFADSTIIEWEEGLARFFDISESSFLLTSYCKDELLLVLVDVDMGGNNSFVVPAFTQGIGSIVSLKGHLFALDDVHKLCNLVLRQQLGYRRSPVVKRSVFE